MRYLIVGAGGIGGYFGARLAADGNDVTFQVRGRQAEAMAHRGLTVLSPLGGVTIEKPQLLSAQVNPGHFDGVLLCTKLWDVESSFYLNGTEPYIKKSVVHQIDSTSASKISPYNYGSCLFCHDGINGPEVNIWHARPIPGVEGWGADRDGIERIR